MNILEGLYEKLLAYTSEDYYPMHMPGHKRNKDVMSMVNPYLLDITEIEGFDNLHQPEGILRELSDRISRLYGALHSFVLVNGSTAGNLAGISAVTNRGDTVLIARNSHKSIYHATMLAGLKPVYCYPPILSTTSIHGGIPPLEIEQALIKNEKTKLVVITSPTYEGVVSDIKAIADIVHRHGALLMVDEAHGAHFGFHKAFPVSAITQGADLVIQSLHKTLPAFTQTAVLHCNQRELSDKLHKYLAMYESSSPSYLLMAGVDRCVQLLEEQGVALFEKYVKKLNKFYTAMEGLNNLEILNRQCIGQNAIYDLDDSKITISVKRAGVTGHELQELLRTKYHIVTEMAAPEYVLAMTSICDTKEGMERLAKALLNIDKELKPEKPIPIPVLTEKLQPTALLSPGETMERLTQKVKLSESCGRISAVFVCLYPPGSPILIPGERIDRELIEYLQWVKKAGFTITGLSCEEIEEIEVIKEEQAE